MVKTTININTKVKVKDIEIEEYEKIMNVWRACMLFFEREIRKLHDRTELTTETLQQIYDLILKHFAEDQEPFVLHSWLKLLCTLIKKIF